KLRERLQGALSQRLDSSHRRAPSSPRYGGRATKLPACLVVSLFACSHAGVPVKAPPADAVGAGERVPWRYEVRLEGPDLHVEARFAPGVTGAPHVDRDAESFVHDTATTMDGGWRVVRYRFALREAAEQLKDVETAIASGDVFV